MWDVMGWGARRAALALGLLLGLGAQAADEVAVTGPAATTQAAEPVTDKATKPVTDRLQVTEAYLELRTGPGRGYPVSHVVMRHDWVEVELRHTDWYRVRTDKGAVGWVTREQLASTLTAAGIQKSFRDVLVDDFLHRRVLMGVGWGRFDGSPLIKVWGGVRLSDTISLEGTVGQVQGEFAGMDQWTTDLVIEPWSEQRWSPFASIGVGRLKRKPLDSLVNATTLRAKQTHAVIGINHYLSDRFILRADWGQHTVYYTDSLTTEYRAWSLGVAFFF